MTETHPPRIVIIDKEGGFKEIDLRFLNLFRRIEGGVKPPGISRKPDEPFRPSISHTPVDITGIAHQVKGGH